MSPQIVLTTISGIKEARKLAQMIIGARLAACVNITPVIESHYRWEGKNVQSEETLLMIKSTTEVYEKLEKFIVEHHPYDVPEIIALPIQAGSAPYLKWISDEVHL